MLKDAQGSRWPCLTPIWVGLLIVAAGCNRHGTSAPGGDGRSPSRISLKRNVELAQAQQRSLVYHVETVGVLEAEGQTEIAAGVTGVVDEVLFREGDVVSPNTVLVKVDQRRYLAALKVAEANERRAVATLAVANDLAKRTQQAGAGASAEERAKATLALGVADAELLAVRAAVDLAQHHLQRSQVRAPYAGRINQRRVTPGSYLEEKTVIATMADLSRIRLVGYVPETAAPLVRDLMAGQEARVRRHRLSLPLGGGLAYPGVWTSLAGLVLAKQDDLPSGFDPEFTLPSFPHRAFRARIFYLSTVADPSTHMFECKAEVDTGGQDLELRPGYSAKVRFPLRSTANACVVPEESVRASERGFIAFSPEQRTSRDGSVDWVARARQLEIGFRAPGWVEVRSGVLPGQWIVSRGSEALEDGTPIRISDAQLAELADR